MRRTMTYGDRMRAIRHRVFAEILDGIALILIVAALGYFIIDRAGDQLVRVLVYLSQGLR